jgi:hypothetical protein
MSTRVGLEADVNSDGIAAVVFGGVGDGLGCDGARVGSRGGSGVGADTSRGGSVVVGIGGVAACPKVSTEIRPTPLTAARTMSVVAVLRPTRGRRTFRR